MNPPAPRETQRRKDAKTQGGRWRTSLDATVRYPTNGDDPTSGAAVYSDPFTLTWDPTVLAFGSAGDYALPGLGGGNFGAALARSGKLSFAWEDPALEGVSVKDGPSIFSIAFDAVRTGSTAIRFGDIPTQREVTVALDLAGFTGIDGQVEAALAPQPPVLAIRIDEGRTVVTVLGAPGSTIQLQAADRLAEAVWSLLAEFLLLSAQVEVIDEGSPGLVERYYRAMVVP